MAEQSPASETLNVPCCIAGGGPAGMMLGYLLARAGVEVLVLEKHADFFRDFRGDTIHPSTLEIMNELGLLEAFLERPHQEVEKLSVRFGDEWIPVVDFSHLPTRCRFVGFMPQWDFLDFLACQARRYRTFQLRMQARVDGLIEEGGRIVGVRAETPQGPLEVRAGLVVAADGRHSSVRELAGMQAEENGVPIDVLWFRLQRRPDDPGQAFLHADRGRLLLVLDRGDYFQSGMVIPKGGLETFKQKGLGYLREQIAAIEPWLGDRLGTLHDWNDVKLLTVKVDRLRSWVRPGLLCIGDAAHAMSPIGGVGINLAIQDAVAAANALAAPLRAGRPTTDELKQVQRRRELPTRVTQRFQLMLQNTLIRRILTGEKTPPLPLMLRLFRRFPAARRIPARLIGLGVRPEHVQTQEDPRAIAPRAAV